MAPRWAGAQWEGERQTPERETAARWGAETSTGTAALLGMAPANWLDHDQAFEQGVAGCNLCGAYIRFDRGDDPDEYVWWTHDDGNGRFVGDDPRNFDAALVGLTGHEVQLPAGSLTRAQVATATAPVLAVLPWMNSASPNADGTINTVGAYDNVSEGAQDYDSRGTAGLFGSHMSRPGPAFAYQEFGAQNVCASGLDTSAAVNRVRAIRVGIGGTADPANRFRLAVYTGGVVNPTNDPGAGVNATLLTDLGQIAASQVTSDNTAVIFLEPGQVFEVQDANTWLVLKDDSNTTQFRVHQVGTFDGELASLPFLFTGAASMDPDPTAPFEAAWNNAGQASFFGPLDMALVRANAPQVTNGESQLAWGVHAGDGGQLANDVSIDASVWCGGTGPDLRDAEFHSGEINIGNLHPVGNQFRFGVQQGGDVSDPLQPTVDGATTLWDAGETTGTDVDVQFVFTAPTGDAAIPYDPDQGLFVGVKSDNLAAGIRLAFDAFPVEDANPPDNPCDFTVPTTNVNGAEVEIPDEAANDSDPAEPWPAVIDGANQFSPGNMPALRVSFRTNGLSAVLVP